MALARAIVFKPDILLLDEPLGALDRKLREELQVELKQLQRTSGVTTLLVTHDQEEALSLSDRIMVLNQGRTQQVAAPAEAYLQAGQPLRRGIPRDRQFRRPGGRPHRSGAARAPAGWSRSASMAAQPAQVVEAIYLGQMVRYHLALDGQRGRASDGGGAAVRRQGVCDGRAGRGVVGYGRYLAGGVR